MGRGDVPDYFSTKDWRKLLDDKDHKTVKKTGVSETLEDYASALKKKDLPKQASTLQAIIAKAGEVKSAQGKFPKITAYLDKVISAAKDALQALAPELEKRSEEATDDGDDSTLAKALMRVRQIKDVDNAWNFVLVPGKPSAGLVVVRKTPKKSDLDKAFEMRGKRAPFFQGKIYFDAGRYVLETPEQPVPGSAKSVKNAAALHAEMNIKVVMRGGGVSLYDDADIEPEDESGTPQPQTDDPNARAVVYDQMLDKFDDAVDAMVKSPTVKIEGTIDGLVGRLKLLRERVSADTALIDHDRGVLEGKINDQIKRLNEAAKVAPVSAKAKYPDLAFWEKLADQIQRLDPSKHEEGWKRFMARHGEMVSQWMTDTDLTETEREEVRLVLDKALMLAGQKLNRQGQMTEAKIEDIDPKVTQRFLALERKFDIIQRTEGLDPKHVELVTRLFNDVRLSYRRGDLTTKSTDLAKAEEAMEVMAKRALAQRQTAAQQQGQAQVHQTLKPAMELVKRAAFPSTLIKDPNAIREAVKADKDLLALIQAGTEVTKKQDQQTFDNLEAAARKVIEAVDKRAGNKKPLPSDDEARRIATEALKRVQMGKMALKYSTLGDPPWDESQAETALELQSQLFFVESAIAKGDVNYTAPSTGNQGGASGSWWIERGEVTRGDPNAPKTSKKYIFKPASTEAPVMTGLPPGSGAPREVLAKKVSDMMAGAGFDVGVTPTTLASIDSSQLGEQLDPKGGPLVGSIQQLAPNGGAIVEKLETDPNFAKTIDKRSFDDVAVFDMIFANLDRHSKNILIDEDKETGKTKLVPIDHGSALPDPEDIYANRVALMPGFNVMADSMLPQGQQPLGAETVEALNRLDPDKMVADMKRQRDDLAKRHPETAGTVSDASIEAMGARVRFIKLVGDSVPVQTLFVMLADGARDIAKCKPEDMPALVKTLRARAERDVTAMKEIDTLSEDMMVISQSSFSLIHSVLMSLGWACGLSTGEVQDWVNNNAALVDRIIKGQIVNPDYKAEYDRLIKKVEALDTDTVKVSDKFKGKNPTLVMNDLFVAAHPEMFGRPDRKAPLDGLQKDYTKLGGDDEIAKVLRAFPVETNNAPVVDPNADPEDQRAALVDRVALLRRWSEFQKIGGVPALLDLGEVIPRNCEVSGAFQKLTDAKSRQKATRDVLALDPVDVDKSLAETFATLEKACLTNHAQLLDVARKKLIGTYIQKAQDLWQKESAISAIGILRYVQTDTADDLERQRTFAENLRAEWATLMEAFDKDEGTAKQLFAPHRNRLFKAVETAADTYGISDGAAAMSEAQSIFDEATLGDESNIGKARKAYQDGLLQIAPYANTPWGAGLRAHVETIATCIATFNWGAAYQNGVEGVKPKVECIALLVKALGGTKPEDLPEEGKKIVSFWAERIVNSIDLYRANQDAKKLTEMLAETAN